MCKLTRHLLTDCGCHGCTSSPGVPPRFTNGHQNYQSRFKNQPDGWSFYPSNADTGCTSLLWLSYRGTNQDNRCEDNRCVIYAISLCSSRYCPSIEHVGFAYTCTHTIALSCIYEALTWVKHLAWIRTWTVQQRKAGRLRTMGRDRSDSLVRQSRMRNIHFVWSGMYCRGLCVCSPTVHLLPVARQMD